MLFCSSFFQKLSFIDGYFPFSYFHNFFLIPFFVWLFPPSRGELGNKKRAEIRAPVQSLFAERSSNTSLDWPVSMRNPIFTCFCTSYVLLSKCICFSSCIDRVRKRVIQFWESVLRNAVRVFQQCKVCFLMFWLIFCLFVFLSCTYIYIYNEKPINV